MNASTPSESLNLETYVPSPRRIDVGGKPLDILPLRVRQIPAFARAVGGAAHLLMGGNLAAAVALHGEDIIKAMAVATGESDDYLGDLLPDDFLLLVATVMEVNADFFVQRVAPQIQAIQCKVKVRMDGAMPSPSSSPTATV